MHLAVGVTAIEAVAVNVNTSAVIVGGTTEVVHSASASEPGPHERGLVLLRIR